jgi:hypothetical protein
MRLDTIRPEHQEGAPTLERPSAAEDSREPQPAGNAARGISVAVAVAGVVWAAIAGVVWFVLL